MYYKQISENQFINAPDAIKKTKQRYTNPTDANFFSLGYWLYVPPEIEEYQKKGTEIIQLNATQVTSNVVDMSEMEKRIKMYNWQHPDRMVRIELSYDLIEFNSGSANQTLIDFKGLLEGRKCPNYENKESNPRSYVVYLRDWYGDEKTQLENIEGYNTWIANGADKTKPYMIIEDLRTLPINLILE